MHNTHTLTRTLLHMFTSSLCVCVCMSLYGMSLYVCLPVCTTHCLVDCESRSSVFVFILQASQRKVIQYETVSNIGTQWVRDIHNICVVCIEFLLIIVITLFWFLFCTTTTTVYGDDNDHNDDNNKTESHVCISCFISHTVQFVRLLFCRSKLLFSKGKKVNWYCCVFEEVKP